MYMMEWLPQASGTTLAHISWSLCLPWLPRNLTLKPPGPWAVLSLQAEPTSPPLLSCIKVTRGRDRHSYASSLSSHVWVAVTVDWSGS